MNKRKKIPKILKEAVKIRQKKRCCCCIEIGKEFHHVQAVALSGSNEYKNIVLLCKRHHDLLHLGDLETCLRILEYVYYLHNKELPNDIEKLKEMAEEIKNKNIEKISA